MPAKFLIQMSGAPGSGKSTLARPLARSIEGVVINHDLIKSYFLSTSHAFDQAAKLSYPLSWVLAEDMIAQGRSVIIDSVCNYDEVIENGSALAKKYGYEYRYVECRVDDIELLDGRLRSREPLRSQRTGVDRPPPDAAGEGQVVDQAALFKKWMNPRRPADNYVVVDTKMSSEECLAYVLKQIVPPTEEGS
ncbi:hypothetical protein B0O99DRAFT_528971 [Bisporella sp. PMI_857]|nr:hypothetical protein B0O99DRAFT_528971 [Bisporella sp. PMI_857]